MSTYITATRCKYEVRDADLEMAEKWLAARFCGDMASASCKEDTSLVYGIEEGLFGGDVTYSWDQDVNDFMREFCLPGSYATFRGDEEYEWYMVQKHGDGNIEWKVIGWDNPFEEECDRLEEA